MSSNLHDQVILITGGNAGLGKETAKRLAAQGASHIWIAARDQNRSLSAIQEIKGISVKNNIEVKFLQLDLTSFESIKTAAETFSNAVTRLDKLVLNAGIMACPPGLTKEGFEIQFGTNHMGHALLVKLLLPLLSRTATEYGTTPRIISVSSVAHKFAPSPQGIHFETLKTSAAKLSTDKRYAQSKLANVLFIRELAKRYPEILAVAVHPGTVKTDLQQSNDGSLLLQFFQKCVVPLIGVSVEEGARNQVWATMDSGVESGQYYVPVGVRSPGSAQSRDEKLMERLWEWTERELDAYLASTHLLSS